MTSNQNNRNMVTIRGEYHRIWQSCVLVLLMLLLCIPAVFAEEDPDNEAIMTVAEASAMFSQEPWVSEKEDSTLLLNADGTGIYTINGKKHEGTWVADSNHSGIFTYSHYGVHEAAFIVKQNAGELILTIDGNRFVQQSTAKARQEEQEIALSAAQEEAESRIYHLSLNETLDLDFGTLTVEKVKVYRCAEQVIPIDELTYPYKPDPEFRYLMLVGRAENKLDTSVLLNNIYAEAEIDGVTCSMESINRIGHGNLAPVSAKGNSDGLWCLSAKIPASTAESFASAAVRFSFTKKFTSIKNFSEGEYFFQLDIDGEMAAAARLDDPREIAYFEETALPLPMSYCNVKQYQSGGYVGVINYYIYQSAFEGDPLLPEYEKYVNALKEAGFEFSNAKDFYDHDSYMIKKDGKLCGWLREIETDFQGISTFRVTLPIFKE